MDYLSPAVVEPCTLTCCCCGAVTQGRQWWNRDDGYGLCDGCITTCHVEDVPVGESDTLEFYGVRGYHWDLPAVEEPEPEDDDEDDEDASSVRVIRDEGGAVIGFE